MELFYKSESENGSDVEESNSCSSTKQPVSESHPATSIHQNVEEPEQQGDSAELTDKMCCVNSMNSSVATEEELATVLSVSPTTLKPSNGGMESELDSPSIQNHYHVKSDNAIKESTLDQVTTEDRETIPVAEMLNSVNETASGESGLEATAGNIGTSNERHCNSTGLDVENQCNNSLFKDSDQGRAQGNKNCLKNSVDHVKILPAHSENSQCVSLFLSEAQTQAETSHNVEEKESISEASGHVEDEIKTAEEPSKFCCKVALAEKSHDFPQDSQDINLHYSETQGHIHINGCETQAITHEDEASCKNEGISEKNNFKKGAFSWAELDAAIRNDEHSDTEVLCFHYFCNDRNVLPSLFTHTLSLCSSVGYFCKRSHSQRASGIFRPSLKLKR